jgi:diacylglycerol O-acyltransferase / wax synthase
MLVPLPVGQPDPVRRLELIAADTAARKGRARPRTGSGILGVAAVQRVRGALNELARSVLVAAP